MGPSFASRRSHDLTGLMGPVPIQVNPKTCIIGVPQELTGHTHAHIQLIKFMYVHTCILLNYLWKYGIIKLFKVWYAKEGSTNIGSLNIFSPIMKR